MHWLGYVLAILNIVGVIAVGSLGSMDYAKRRAWAFSLYLHELALQGLPVDETAKDPQGRPLTERLSEEVLAELFTPPAVGSPVVTQMDEVNRVKDLLRTQANQGLGAQRLAFQARVLLPLATTQLEREHLLFCRNHFATKQTETAFKSRFQKAWAQALKAPPEAPAGGKQPDSLEKAFRLALLEQEGGSAEPFTQEFLLKIPADRRAAQAVNFDQVYEQVVALLQERYTRRLDDAFDVAAAVAAASGAANTEPRKSLTGDPRRVAIARLLFNACPLLAEQAINEGKGGVKDAELLKGLPPGLAMHQLRLLDTDAYKNAVLRLRIVVGVRALTDAMTEQGEMVRQMYADLLREMSAERLQFVGAHGVLLEAVIEKAAQTEAEVALLAREQQNLTDQEGLVKRRQADVKQHEDELAEARARTAAELKKLEEMSQKLFDLRIILRDTRAKNLGGEQKIRELERRIRELESK
jgi:hypothetical protein